jgi:hypothetical protein
MLNQFGVVFEKVDDYARKCLAVLNFGILFI